MALSVRQQRFVDLVLSGIPAGRAYEQAGYKARGNAAETCAARLLRNAQVAAAVAARLETQAQSTDITVQRWLRELALVAFGDIGQLLDFSGEQPCLRPASEIPEDARRGVASYKVKRYMEGAGDNAREVEVTEVKLWDKLGALEKLGKHFGWLKERVQLDGPPFKLYAGFDPAQVVCPQPPTPQPAPTK